MVTVALLAARFSLIRRSAGIVYISDTIYPALATSVIVKGPTGTTISDVHVPTGIVRVLPAKVKVKSPVTPVPSASLQICRRPVGAGVAVAGPGVRVGLGVTMAVGVLVGSPLTLFLKITSVTPVPIFTTTFPIERFLLTLRLSGKTSILATT